MTDNVYAKRGIKFYFIAEPFNNQYPLIDIFYENPTTKSKQILAENVEITSTDHQTPNLVIVEPVTKGGVQWISIVVKSKDEKAFDANHPNLVITGIDCDHCLDENNEKANHYLSWSWNEIDINGNKIQNDNESFGFIKVPHPSECKLKFDFIEISKYGISDDDFREGITEEGLTYLPIPYVIISPDKKDNRLTLDGVESFDYDILEDSSALRVHSLDIFAPEEFEFIALRNVVFKQD